MADEEQAAEESLPEIIVVEESPPDQYSPGGPIALALASEESQPSKSDDPSPFDQYGPSGANTRELQSDRERIQREAANAQGNAEVQT